MVNGERIPTFGEVESKMKDGELRYDGVQVIGSHLLLQRAVESKKL